MRFSLMLLTSMMTNIHAAIDKSLSPAEITAISKEAYMYAYPMVDHYRASQLQKKEPFRVQTQTRRTGGWGWICALSLSC